ncbi:GerAB/ArcD/ProY family transporter [Paenibacillus mendelii]|uniref:Endospore germination permease n=1 Tax=Paenibacillus mendelii TaxID=206163 RepID=A0ABV6JAM0_9BACL|nr:endospore germination permease [Paenibacillus mendelii]MCQ6560792.1 endospore germination permease [Paenibacillus mendelii]
MNFKSFGLWPVAMMLALSVGLSNHVIVLPTILQTSGRDAWLCSVGSFLVALPWIIWIVHSIMKRTKQTRLQEWLFQRVPKLLGWILLTPVLLLFITNSFQTFVETASWTSATYLPATPEIVILLCLIGLTAYGAWSGIRAITYMSCLLLPAVVLLGDFVMTANMPDKNYHLLLPILADGFPQVISGSFYSLGGTLELALILFFQQRLKTKVAWWHLVLLLAFVSILTIGPAIGAIAEFGPIEAEKLRYPAFAQWRLVTIGRYIEHLDFFAIFQWLSGAFVRISLGMYLVIDLLPIRSQKKQRAALLFLCLVYIVAGQQLMNNTIDSEKLTRLLFVADVIVLGGFTIIIWLLSFKPSKGKVKEDAGTGTPG